MDQRGISDREAEPQTGQLLSLKIPELKVAATFSNFQIAEEPAK